MKKTYAGSCHCGAVRFEADIDLAAGTSKCNCSICAKSRFWKAIIGKTDLRLIKGEGDLAEYTFHSGEKRHRFCKHCGVKVFGFGTHPAIGEFYAVSLACLDDASDEELAAAPVVYQDGRNDRWDVGPLITGYL